MTVRAVEPGADGHVTTPPATPAAATAPRRSVRRRVVPGAGGTGAGGTPADQPARPGRTGRRRAGRAVRGWWWLTVPLSIFGFSRGLQMVLLYWMRDSDEPIRDTLLSWDAGWFVRVADDGYPHGYSYTDDGELTGNGLAFFPGFPLLIRLGHAVFGWEHGTAAIAVAWICAAVAAALVYALGAALYDDRVATILTLLVCTQPMSVVLSMGYSEALFIALVAGALLATYRQRWLLAGLVGFAAGLSRPTGAAVALAILVAAVLHVRKGGNGPRRWWALAGAALAVAGVPSYLTWVAVRVGDPMAWFEIQGRGWGTRFDFGGMAWEFVRGSLRAAGGWVEVSVAWLLILVVVAVVLAVRARVWPPLVVYGLVALTLAVGQAGYYHSKPRLLVPVLLTLVPLALALARAGRTTMMLGCALFAFFGTWYGAYLVTVWPYAI